MRPYPALALAALFLLPVLGGCTGDKPTRLYVLSAMPDAPGSNSGQGIPIGVGPVTLPKYLDRPQIITRMNGNALSQAQFDQWGGDLNDNITRVLASNLSELLKTDRVSLYPWKDRAPVDYEVTLDVTRFEQVGDGSVVLSVFWSVVDPKDGKVLLMRRSDYRDNHGVAKASTSSTPNGTSTAAGTTGPGTPDGARPYDALVAAMSRDLELLSRDVAAAIIELRGS
jgi:uncharacterized lipoprotein YmbA